MIFGTAYVRNENELHECEAATMALGEVLSTPAGVILLNELSDDLYYESSRNDEYFQMVRNGKRPSKTRENLYGQSRYYGGEAYGLKEALIALIQQTTNWTIRRRAARRVLNDELEYMHYHGTTNLYVKCMSLMYAGE